MRKYGKTAALVLAFATICTASQAWGPVSHIALSYEAGSKNGFPVSQELIGAYLAGATEPDVGLDDGKSEDYGVYHSEDYAKAMESAAQKISSPDREILMARAAGIRSHMAGDSSAHGTNGYSDAKTIFPNLQTGMPTHTTNELCIDMIMYDRNRAGLKKQSLNFMDVDTLIAVRKEYTALTGKPLENDREKLKKELFNHKAMVLTELSLANHLSISDPDKLAQMREAYSDLSTGAADGKGTDLAISRISEQARPSEDLTGFKTTNRGARIKDFLENSLLAKSFQALERGALKLTKISAIRDSALDFAEGKASTTRNKAFVNFGRNLLNKNLTFKQAVILAGKSTTGYPDNVEQKLAYLEIEAQALKAERDKTAADFNNRPWWKFWLVFTQSDKKKYLAAEAAYQEKLLQIKQQKALLNDSAPATGSDDNFAAAVTEASRVAEGQTDRNFKAGLVELQAKVEAAYKKVAATSDSQNQEKAKQAVQELLEAQDQLKKALEN